MDKFGMVGSGVRVWSFPRWMTLSLRSQKREKNRTAKNLVDCGGVRHDASGAVSKDSTWKYCSVHIRKTYVQ